MGCGCGRNKKKKRMQSSRVPGLSKPPKARKINGINVPSNLTPDQRRSTVAKIKNSKMTRSDHIKARKSLER